MTTLFQLDDELESRLQDLARQHQRSTDWVMRQALQQYVDREEKRNAFHSDALHAWQQYQESGQHVTQSKADAWLAKLEAGDDADLPLWRN